MNKISHEHMDTQVMHEEGVCVRVCVYVYAASCVKTKQKS